jgi:tetratricopeptide (TPR) repeat protein
VEGRRSRKFVSSILHRSLLRAARRPSGGPYAPVRGHAVHEDNGKHVKALRLYESVLARHPSDSYALRGMARTLARLGRGEEAQVAYNKALRASGG